MGDDVLHAAFPDPRVEAEGHRRLQGAAVASKPFWMARAISASLQPPMPAVGCEVMLAATLVGLSGTPSRNGKARPPLPSPVLKSLTPCENAG